MLLIFSSPLIGLLINILVNFSVLRLSKGTGVVSSLGYSTAAGLLVVLAMPIYTQEFEHLPPNSVIYLALSYCFFHFVHIPVASVRIRVLLELAKRTKVSEAELLRTYGASHILEFRLKRLTDTGQIAETSGAFTTKVKRIYYVAAVLATLKRFVNRGEVQL